MTVHRIKLKDFNEHFIKKLKEELADGELELEIRINSNSDPCGEKPMNENLFWHIISLFDWKQAGDDYAIMEPAIDFLSGCSIQNIKSFQNILSEKLYTLDAESFAKNMGSFSYQSEDIYFSVDHFLHVRCCVIANGKTFFEQVLHNPASMPKDLTFEPLLSLPYLAFERKTGFEMESVPTFNIETFSNKKGWKLNTSSNT